jgi:hypothetical protein
MPDQPVSSAARDRCFVLNLGRCGSSLLGAILADAGADFGVAAPDTWDPRTGQMETAGIRRAAHHFRRAHDISEGRKFLLSPVLERKLRLHRARRCLRVALAQSRFLKIGDLDLVVQPAFKLGYVPSVIVNFRQLEPMLPSLLVGRTNVGPDELAREYVRVYRQALMLLQTFGGCTVEYNELLDSQAREWADGLAVVAACTPETLLEARARRVAGEPDPAAVTPVYQEAFELFHMLRTYRGRAVERSRQAARAIAARS